MEDPMEVVKRSVKSKGNVVAEVEVEKFVTLDEAVEYFEGEDKPLAYINQMHLIRVQDEARRQAAGTGQRIPKELMKALRENPELLAKVAEQMGIEIS